MPVPNQCNLNRFRIVHELYSGDYGGRLNGIVVVGAHLGFWSFCLIHPDVSNQTNQMAGWCCLGKGDPHYQAAHLGLDYWNNIPADYRLWNSYNLKSDRRKQGDIHSKLRAFLVRILPRYLTTPQYKVMILCLLEFHCTQNAAAQLLGIRQPTVSQHLNGKWRDGKKVGGARSRIQRKIRTIVMSQDWSAEERQYLNYLQSLVRTDLSYRQRQKQFRKLS